MTIYQLDPNSWMRVPEEQNRPLTCAELGPKLADYADRMNFTHLEFLSLPATRVKEEVVQLIDFLHSRKLGVILAGVSPRTETDLHADGWRDATVVSMGQGDSFLKLKWDEQWSHDTVDYLSHDPIQRKLYHEKLTSRSGYAFQDNYILSLALDLALPGKKSLTQQMPGDDWQKFANLRLLFADQAAQPGRKMIYMGSEFGQWNAWAPDTSLDWHLLQGDSFHGKLQRWVSELNRFYLNESAFRNDDQEEFEWINTSDAECSTLAWLRKDPATRECVLAVFNFTPVPRYNYRVGVPSGGFWREAMNSDAREYGGSGQGNMGGVEASPFGWNFKTHSLNITLPPLGALFFKNIY
jgi:1,4-alpha-glucan branching enzyme